MLLKYRSKPKFRFNKIYLRPLKNGRISKADDYFWKINRRLKAHYRPIAAGQIFILNHDNFPKKIYTSL
jgi:hypothetical protein